MKPILLFLFLTCLFCIEIKAQEYCCNDYKSDIEGLYNDCEYSLALKKLNNMLKYCDQCEGIANSWRSRIQQCLNDANASGCPACGSSGSTDTDGDGILDIDDQCDTKQGPASNYGCPVVEVEQDFCPMVYVQGGTFTMGCTAEQGSDCYGDESPAHSVTLGNYWIGKYEVTQAEWRSIMGSNPSYFKDCDNCPVESVSWEDIQGFLRTLNQKYPGRNYRLPTEAEWEYAARGGNKKDGTKYAGSSSIDNVAWYGNSNDKTHPVGGKSPNGLGLYDMSGNVWEWCSDWYGSYSSSSQTNPTGASSGSYRVYRGGSWYYGTRYSRTSNRSYNSPSYRDRSLGFRISRTE